MNPELRNLISLQDLDQKIAGLQKQIAEIPSKIQTLQDELQLLRKMHQDRTASNQELAKHRRASEGEVDLMRAKLSKLKDQLMAVKTNKEYTAMLHEIQAAETQIRGEEDRILEIMEQLETGERELRSSEKSIDVRSREIENTVRAMEESVFTMESEAARLREEKARMEALVETELLSRYRRLANARKGIALAEAREELCSVCHVRIRPQVFADLLRSETIYCCDSCDRILFLRETV